jgi:hypothetical protein
MEASMSRLDDFISDLMFDVVQDRWGVWEVGGIAQTSFRDLPKPESERLARAAVQDLLNRGWVELLQQEWDAKRQAPGEEVEVPPDRIPAILANAAFWNADDVRVSRVRYMVSATERGVREFQESLDRKRRERG